MSEDLERILRVPLPLDLIRRMDELISRGAGGFSGRAELIREAVEAMVMELAYAPAPDEPIAGLPEAALSRHEKRQARLPSSSGSGEVSLDASASLEWTMLRVSSRGLQIDGGVAEVKAEPLFGVHNRDYPSLWAAARLAALTGAQLIPAEDFFDLIVAEGWDFGARLSSLDGLFGFKTSALFPTNRAKPQSAASVFATFAVGTYAQQESRVIASGPLFQWSVCQLQPVSGRLCIGMTGAGYNLLESMDGLTAAMPHGREHADPFFSHLRQHAPFDWLGFGVVLETLDSGVTRSDLISAFERWWPEWTASKASTNAAGYIARAREWGLVAPKQFEGRYMLTKYGEELRQRLHVD